jgi:hypothetical protein
MKVNMQPCSKLTRINSNPSEEVGKMLLSYVKWNINHLVLNSTLSAKNQIANCKQRTVRPGFDSRQEQDFFNQDIHTGCGTNPISCPMGLTMANFLPHDRSLRPARNGCGKCLGHALLKNLPQVSFLNSSSSYAVESIVKCVFDY